MRRGFALVEMLLVIGIIGALTVLSLPALREYSIRSDLDNATQQATQGLGRAKLKSQNGDKDSAWGFYVPNGTLYKGQSYAARDPSFDEVYPMPSTIAVSGLLDVSYSRLRGLPSSTGSIILRDLNNDQRIISVTIAVNAQSIATDQSDVLVLCYQGKTISVPDATLPYYQSKGASMGACPGASSSAASSVSSHSSSAASSVASSSSSAGNNTTSTCPSKYSIGANGLINFAASTNITFTNLESLITYGTGGPPVNVHVCYSTDAGNGWSPLFGGSGNCKGTNGNAFGNSVQPNGTDTKTHGFNAGQTLTLLVNGIYKQQGWLAFDETFTSTDQTGHILFLKNGDSLQYEPGFGDQTALKNYLISKGKANAQGQITIGQCEMLAVNELETLNTPQADFQDDVMWMQFN